MMLHAAAPNYVHKQFKNKNTVNTTAVRRGWCAQPTPQLDIMCCALRAILACVGLGALVVLTLPAGYALRYASSDYASKEEAAVHGDFWHIDRRLLLSGALAVTVALLAAWLAFALMVAGARCACGPRLSVEQRLAQLEAASCGRIVDDTSQAHAHKV